MHVQLVMFKSDGTRREFSLTRDRIVIGRTNEVGLRIPLASVSRKHCEIAVEGGVVKMRDLGSSNGTLHNSVRVKEAVLAAGDQVSVGPVVFTVVIDGVPAWFEPVRSLLEQELVDTSVGMPAATEEDEEAAPQPAAPTSARIEQPVAKPKTPEAPAKPEEDPLAAAARAAEAAPKKAPPPLPGDSFSDSATVVDLDDPIAALERLAAAQSEFKESSSKSKKEK